MRSMTGYGRATDENERFRVTVSVRAVNHRFLDLVLRMPEGVREIEREVRSAVSEEFARGRVELRVGLDEVGTTEGSVCLDSRLVRELLDAIGQLEDERLEARQLTPADLLAVPDLVSVRREAASLEAEDRALVLDVVVAALRDAGTMRAEEGSGLERALASRLDELEALTGKLAARRQEVRDSLLAGARERLRELLDDVEVDEVRLAQEVALLAEKSDVQEELDRLGGHLGHVREAMKGEGALGRRLDFLAQEIHRELNTLGAKCRNLEMAQWVVDAKVSCEQLREQVQNVE